jgi:DNA-binding response OmpR family regulator/predicted regulator of Ras-like GTPase activity (Roadblock/LC7/MglB family)
VTQNVRILLVDDDEIFRKTLSEALRLAKYKVDTADGARQAMEKLKAGKYTLMITDLNMPEIDGIELIRQAIEMDPYMHVIIATGFPSHESQAEAFSLGVLNYIVKPFTVMRLLEIIEKSLREDGERFVGPVELCCEDLIQLYSLGCRSIVLEVRKGKEMGIIYFDKGKVVHAKTNQNEGEAAFYEIQSWKFGIFKTKPYEKRVVPSINSDVSTLLLEGARLRDEIAQKREAHLSVKKSTKDSGTTSANQAAFEGIKHSAENPQTQQNFAKEVIMSFNKMKDVEILRYVVEEVDGAFAAGLISMDGISMGVYSKVEGFDTKTADAEFASMLRAAKKAAASLGPAFGAVDELMMAGTMGIVIARMIGDKYYTGIALNKDGNIGKARMLQQRIVTEMYPRYYGKPMPGTKTKSGKG